jgi:benzoyl-CoA reductase/2-hydroxyglutaryl-CoA dehydratase subunit BcrC/BadD/HgdB
MERAGEGKVSSNSLKPKMILTGSILSATELLNIIEKAGMEIVCEDFDDKLGYFRTQYRVQDDDVLLNLAVSYLEKPPSAAVGHSQRRVEHIINLVQEFNADGVIYHVLKFDDPYLFEYPDIKDAFRDRNIPIAKIETEVGNIAEGQVKTRIQAFMDMISIR